VQCSRNNGIIDTLKTIEYTIMMILKGILGAALVWAAFWSFLAIGYMI